MRTYSYELKKEVVGKYFEGHAIRDLVQTYGISDGRVARRWVKKVREGGYEALTNKRKPSAKQRKNLETKAKKKELTSDEKIEHQALQIELLKKLLELERG